MNLFFIRKDDNSNNTILTFFYEEMNDKETGNKLFDDSDHQHYLMHHGLLYNVSRNVTVKNTTFRGTVGKNSDGSGALIFGSVNGNTENLNKVWLDNVTLDGLCVTGVNEDKISGTSAVEYAPLLINKIGADVTLTVNGLFTAAGYTTDTITTYAATSLIGKVGDATATNINMDFSNIALDSRVSADSRTTYVWNNGQSENHQVEYYTYHTIFTQATLLEFFQYSSDSSGIYNFNSHDTKVTYGKEISNTSNGRNTGEQYWYYDNDDYVWDGTGTQPDGSSIATFFSEEKYLRYVKQSENEKTNGHELDINLRTAHLDVGCGTYGHPYWITNGKQLTALADYLVSGRANKWVVCVNDNVFESRKQDSGNYHTDKSNQDTYNDSWYMCDGVTWYVATKGEDGKFAKGKEVSGITTAGMRAYLRNAYYQIQNDINISSSTYMGIGGKVTSSNEANAFSGVIVGKNIGTEETPNYPTVYISSNITNATSFGGLVRYSQGSVIKDLKVSYAGGIITEDEKERQIKAANIIMSNEEVSSSSNNPFFGGVVGYCMGGDTIIDNVSVKYGERSVNLNGSKERMIAAGGYVGLVGGAKDNSDYEKTGGGVVFRNMGETSNNFAYTLSYAGSESPTLVPDSTCYAYGEDAEALGCTYFFCNRYVGRVLDGYACSEGCTVDNTDKNYTIPQLTDGESDLVVDNNSNVAVNNAQGLWLLSAIVNSGAGAMDIGGTYTDYNGKTVDAYQIGRPRSGAYDGIGTAEGDLADEAYWGGVETTDTKRVSYLVSKYVTNAQYLCGRSNTSSNTSANSSVTLTFSQNIDMTPYGNGFRGIGASYTVSRNLWDENNDISLPKNYRRALLVSGINVDSTSATTIKLNMNQREYHPGGQDEDYERGFWNQGAGLFTAFSYTGTTQVNNLTLSGMVCLNTFKPDKGQLSAVYKKKYDFCVGGFAGLISNTSSKNKVTFTNLTLEGLKVYGGTTTGGVFGITSRFVLDFPSFNISSVDVIKTVTNDGSIGGLVGLKMGAMTIGTRSTTDSPVDPSIIKNLKVQMFGSKVSTQSCGGLIGCSDGGDLTIQNISADQLTVLGADTRDVGGLVSCFRMGGRLTISDCELNSLTVGSTGNDEKRVGGLVGAVEKPVAISNVRINTATMSVAYGHSLGGFVGYATDIMTLDDCHIASGSLYMSGKNKPYLGGMVGYSSSSNTIKNCTETELSILSGDSDAGGLVGQMNGGSTNASNVSFSNVKVVTKNSGKSVGLLAGHTNGKPMNAYNILADTCTVGYNLSASIVDLGTIISTGTYNGLWLGGSKDKDSKLVAVAVKGENQPQNDVGKTENCTVQVTYADYPVEQANTTGSASPWLDVNPRVTLSVKESASAKDQTLTGNGVGYITTTTTSTDAEGNQTTTTVKGNSIAQTILEEAASSDTSSQKKYWNLTEKETYPQFIATSSEASNGDDSYVITYQNEEKGNTTVHPDTDFPILVVSGLAKADTEIWNYIAAMTNVANGSAAKDQAMGVDAATYKWTKDADATEGADGTFAGSFVKQSTSQSLSVNAKDISIAKDAYDNQQSQFTLLTVKYDDPTDSGENAFYLYVPVLVKKVMDVKVNVDILAGTNYYAEDYIVFRNKNHYATARPGEPVTAYLEYNYHRTEDEWQAALDAGENLLWYYKKQIYFATEDDTKLPSGTKLTLVDAQTGKMYSKQLAETYSNSCLDFAEIFNDFQDKSICDLLNIAAADYTEGTDKNAYVETREEEATVKAQGKYYRPYDATKDTDAEKKTLTIGSNVVGIDDYLNQGDTYFLTMEVPDTQTTVINELIGYTPKSLERVGSAPPNKVEKETDRSRYNDRIVIYDGVQQTFSVGTQRVAGSPSSQGGSTGTIMSDGDALKVTLRTELSLLEDKKQNFKAYTPNTMFQQFIVNLKNYDNTNAATPVKIMADTALWTLTVKDQAGTELDSLTGADDVYGKDTLSIVYKGRNTQEGDKLPAWIEDSAHTKIIIEAVVTLTYTTVANQFPARLNESDPTGIGVSAQSRVANSESQLPITTLKSSVGDSNRYYIEKLSYATLDYSMKPSVETSNGDKNAPLGINASEAGDETSFTIDTIGNYDCSGVDETVMNQAESIRYTLQLYQKDQNADTYSGDPLQIGAYWTSCTMGQDLSEKQIVITQDKPSSGNTKTFQIPISFTVLTGKLFEEKGLMYSNYKVTLKAELLDDSGKSLNGTEAMDYIIYTNARIYPQMMTELSTSNGN